MSAIKLLLVILFAFSAPRLAARYSEMIDYRADFALHAFPIDTVSVLVVSAQNYIFDAPVIQGFSPDLVCQLETCNLARQFMSDLHASDISLCVGCMLDPHGRADAVNRFPVGQFIFLKENSFRDKHLKEELESREYRNFSSNNQKVYEDDFAERKTFLCLPKPGLMIATNDKQLMENILSRIDAWWQPRVALPSSLKEWKYVNQSAPYWGIRHFVSHRKDCLTDVYTNCPDNHALGVTFEYFEMRQGFEMTYVSETKNWFKYPTQLTFETNDELNKNLKVVRIDDIATKLIASDVMATCAAACCAYQYLVPSWGESARLRRLETLPCNSRGG